MFSNESKSPKLTGHPVGQVGRQSPNWETLPRDLYKTAEEAIKQHPDKAEYILAALHADRPGLTPIFQPTYFVGEPPVNAETLPERAARLFPDNEALQRKWLAAVEYLVTKSKPGWVPYWDSKLKRHIVGGENLEKRFGM